MTVKATNKLVVMLSSFALVFTTLGCKQVVKDRSSLQVYLKKHETTYQSAIYNGTDVSMGYVPTSLLDSSKDGGANPNYAHNYYFRLSLSRNGKEAIRQLGSFERYSEMVQVLFFQMGAHIYAATPNKDTVALADYAFEQLYGMSSANNLLLVFNKDKLQAKDYFDIYIDEFGMGMGTVHFRFYPKKLEDVPKIEAG